MNEANRAFLRGLNRRFYRRYAASFSSSRERPWKGWLPVEQRVRHLAPSATSTAILDVGCGNARFARFWLERGVHAQEIRRIDYYGQDSSWPLLQQAQSRLLAERAEANGLASRFLASEVRGEQEDLRELGDARFDCALLFGVLHHIPGLAQRSRLLACCARLLRPGGLLAVSFWRFAHRARTLERALPWGEVPLPVPDDLERGDFLLPWGGGDRTPAASRYCHHTSEEEASDLVSSLSLEVVDRYLADGKDGCSNLYYLLRLPD